MLFNRYQAATDTIQHFEKNRPFAYTMPRVQRDAPTAADALGEASCCTASKSTRCRFVVDLITNRLQDW